jgi:intracellular multiplication protein IcmP
MSGGGGGKGDDKNSMAILWIIGFVFIVGVISWFAFSYQLKYIFIKIRMIEMYLVWICVKFLPSSIAAVASMQDEVHKGLLVTKAMTPDMLTGPYAWQLSEIAGNYLRIPITILLAWFCYLMYGRNVKMRYRKKYDMHSLAEQESEVWPQINPVMKANIVEAELNAGPWAMAQAPVEFCKHYNLISIRVEMPTSILQKGPKFIMVLNKARADRVFAAQLGRLWAGPEHLPIHKRAIFAAFIARGCRDTKAARELLLQINRSCVDGKLDHLDFRGADALWKKYVNDRAVTDIIKKHAYESTVFMALFLYAREDGVFATADFLWLKPFDRKFWYFLNNVGRQTAFCEAAGVHAHYLAECALQRPLGVPMVGEASKALDLALKDIIYTPTPEERDELLRQVVPGVTV